MTTRVEQAVSSFKQGCNCAQAVFATYAEQLGFDRGKALKIACGFGGGMRMGETCGAVTGAFMVIGLKYASGDPQDKDAKQKAYELVQKFTREFRTRNGSVVCKELLGCDVSTPEGAKIATEKGLFRSFCPKMVQDAAEILEEMLNR